MTTYFPRPFATQTIPVVHSISMKRPKHLLSASSLALLLACALLCHVTLARPIQFDDEDVGELELEEAYPHDRSLLSTFQGVDNVGCDLSVGDWVYDRPYRPRYNMTTCPYLEVRSRNA